MKYAAYTHLSIAALVFMASVGAYAYWYHMLAEANAKVADLSAQIAAAEAAQISSQNAAAELADLKGAQSDIEGYFVVSDNVVGFLEALQSLGRSLGTTVTVASVNAVQSPRPHIDLSLTASGSFAAVMRTVGAIEYSPYDITVNTLNLSTTNSDDASHWTAAFTLSVGTALPVHKTAATTTTP
jgi:hypothetical protein